MRVEKYLLFIMFICIFYSCVEQGSRGRSNQTQIDAEIETIDDATVVNAEMDAEVSTELDAEVSTELDAETYVELDSELDASFDASLDAEIAFVQIEGVVKNRDNEPIEGARVNVSQGSQVPVITDINGYYNIEMVATERQVLNIEADGYVPQHRVITPQNFDTVHIFNITLAQIAPSIPIDATLGGIASSLGASLSLSPDSLIRPNGELVNGEVSVELTPFDVTTAELEFMPGDFTGIDEQGESVHIESFGFVKVRVLQENEEVQLIEGTTATLEIPIASTQVDSAPSMIPLWNFDEEVGLWIQKGFALKIQLEDGSWVYRGELESFGSFWNCDQIMEVVDMFFFVGDLAAWLFPGSWALRVAWIATSRIYTVVNTINHIRQFDPDNPNVGEMLRIAQGLTGALRLVKLNPLESQAISQTISKIEELEAEWNSFVFDSMNEPETFTLVLQADRSVRELNLISDYYQQVLNEIEVIDVSMQIELSQRSLEPIQNIINQTEFSEIEALNSSLSAQLSEVDQIFTKVSEISTEIPQSPKFLIECFEQIDSFYFMIKTTANEQGIEINLEQADPNASSTALELELNQLYRTLRTIDNELSKLNILWTSESESPVSVEAEGVDYRGTTQGSLDVVGLVTLPARFDSEVDLVITQEGIESAPIRVQTAVTPNESSYLGLLFPSLPQDLTSFKALIEQEDQTPISNALVSLKEVHNEDRAFERFGPFKSDHEGHVLIKLRRSEPEEIDLNNNQINGETYYFATTILNEGVIYKFNERASPIRAGTWKPKYETVSQHYTLAKGCLSGRLISEEGELIPSAQVRVGQPDFGFGLPRPSDEQGYFELDAQRSEGANDDFDHDQIMGEQHFTTLIVNYNGNLFSFDDLPTPTSSSANGCLDLGHLIIEDRILQSGISVTGAIDILEEVYTYTLEVNEESLIEVELTNEPALETKVQYTIIVKDPNGQVIGRVSDTRQNRSVTLKSTYYAAIPGQYTVLVKDHWDQYIDEAPFVLTVTTLTPPDQAQEPDNTREQAYSLSLGQSHESYLSYYGDQDYYLISLEGEQLIDVSLSTNSTTLDTRIWFSALNSESTFSCQNLYLDPQSQATRSCYIPEAGDYLIVVDGRWDYDYDREQPYQLTVVQTVFPDQTQEPDNTREQAYSLSLGQSHESYLSYYGDQDYYLISLEGEQLIDVTLSTNSETLDARIVFSALNSESTFSCQNLYLDPQSQATRSCYIPEAGDYLIKIDGYLDYDYDREQPYQLTVVQTVFPDQAQEPDNTIEQAYSLNLGQSHESYLSYYNDQDYYLISLEGEQLIDVTLSTNSETLDARIVFSALHSESTFSCQNLYLDPQSQATRSCYIPEAGDYLIKIDGYLDYDYDREQPYQLTVVQTVFPDQAQEPDNTIEQAYSLNLGQSHESYLSYYNDQDYYLISLEGEQLIDVTLSTNSETLDARIVFSALHSESTFSCQNLYLDPQSQATRSCYIPEAGDYLIKIDGYLDYDYDREQPYQLTVVQTVFPDQAQEPDNTIEQAYSLNLGQSHESYLSYYNDQDYYLISLEGEQLIDVTLSTNSETLDARIVFSALHSESTFSCQNLYLDPQSQATRSCYIPEAGDYLIKIDGYLDYDYDREQPYQLSIIESMQ